MVHITNTTHNLGNFTVRDDTGSYDNPYNQALIEYERSEAFRQAGSHIVHLARESALKGLKIAGKGILSGLETYIASGQ